MRPEEADATTVAGYVSELVGHIPQRGEVIESNGLRFEIVASTDRRVEKLRVSMIHRSESQATQPAGDTSKRSQSR